MEESGYHSPDACIIPTFQNKFLKLKLQQIFSVFKLISNDFLGEKYVTQKNTKEETKTKSMRPKILQTLNMNQF